MFLSRSIPFLCSAAASISVLIIVISINVAGWKVDRVGNVSAPFDAVQGPTVVGAGRLCVDQYPVLVRHDRQQVSGR